MKILSCEIPDVKIIEPVIYNDDRGYFYESFRHDLFEKEIGPVHFVQDNESFSTYGVLRGLHFQKPPMSQGKLVRVTKGEVLDVAVDIRVGSPWFGKHVARRLSNENKKQMWIPRGFAHGYIVLSEEAVFFYKCDNYFSLELSQGIKYDDRTLNINWILAKSHLRISDKDLNNKCYCELLHNRYFFY